MARHFLQLYVLIVVTLVGASWGQDQLTKVSLRYASEEETHVEPAQGAVLRLVTSRLMEVAPGEREHVAADLGRTLSLDIDLLALHDIAGPAIVRRLDGGAPAVMAANDRETWVLQKLAASEQVVVVKFAAPFVSRSTAEWALSLAFFALIALVIMLWLWPLTRDLRQLERSTTTFGDRNWRFDAAINARSQVYPLAAAFRRMAARIDGLIGSHKDMTNAMSHEIKTPLARMRFEVEVAREATTAEQFARHLDNINADIAELNSFVTATLDYAILERAEVALNVSEHDFTKILPALTDAARKLGNGAVEFTCAVDAEARAVRCDAHLIETVVRNLVYNAARYAKRHVKVSFLLEQARGYALIVDDDGPGIPEAQRQRVFESFVQLEQPTATKTGFGLGLAIVSRIVEWHRGSASVTTSPLGGARFMVRWRPDGV